MDRKLFAYCTAARSGLIVVVGLGVLGLGATIAQMTFLSRIVSQVLLIHAHLEQLMPLILLLLSMIVLRAGLAWGRELAARRSAITVKSEMRRRLFAHVLRLGPSFCRQERTGELVATLNEGIERLDAYVSRYLPQIALSGIIPALIIIFIWPIDWPSAALLLITGPVIPLMMVLVGSYSEKHIQRQWTALSRLSAHFLDTIQGLATLKLFGRSRAEQARITSVSEEFRERTMKVLRYAFLSGAVLEFMIAIAIGLVAVVLGVRLLNRSIPFEQAFLVLLLAPEFYRPLRELGTQHHAGMEGRAAGRRMIEILETPLPPQAQESEETRPSGPLTIECRDLTFTYPGSEQPALRRVNLTLPAHTCTALIGRSGAGKSTLVNLLMGFNEADSGTITANGVPLGALSPDDWRAYVALVPQRPYLFSGSVRANIQMARPQASSEEVERAAQLAGAAAFIKALPRGYETEVGEQGARLSAGQAQRIAIARAFLKDAPLLILDEPTSSLDAESEALIAQALKLLMRNRTVLVIAHRSTTLSGADQVVVLDAGQVVETGQPEQLLARGDSACIRLVGASYRQEECV
ncbi:MAG TPA: thiol reductant ABC exporter subunit CydD [Ktedonobacteraceae bacterium]|nr:thiol reductant ABC exporter subunit CydD [Ktedonobacteraceae bacterium]